VLVVARRAVVALGIDVDAGVCVAHQRRDVFLVRGEVASEPIDLAASY
jgi:hypothetical protein